MLIHLGSDVGFLSCLRQIAFSCVWVFSLLIGFGRGKWQITSLLPCHQCFASFTLQFASQFAHVTWRLTTRSWLNNQRKDLFFKIYAIIVSKAGQLCHSNQCRLSAEYKCAEATEVLLRGQRSSVADVACHSDACLHNDIGLHKHADDPTVCSISNPDFVIYSSVVSFYLPFVVTLLVYIRIYVFLRMRRKRITFSQASGKVLPDSTPPSVVGHSSFTCVCQWLLGLVHSNEEFSNIFSFFNFCVIINLYWCSTPKPYFSLAIFTQCGNIDHN